MWNEMIQFLWAICWVIALIAIVCEFVIWVADGPTFNFKHWRATRVNVYTRTLFHAVVALLSIVVLASPFFVESINDYGYAVFTKEGEFVKIIDGSKAFISQSSWNKQTEGMEVEELSKVRINNDMAHFTTWALCTPNVRHVEDGVYCVITLTADNSHTNLIRRLEAWHKHKLSGINQLDYLIAQLSSEMPEFKAVKEVACTAAKEKREITLEEKSRLYVTIAPMVAKLQSEYGIQILDISMRK